MTAGVLAMLLGVFVVPMALLWAGHRMRRRSARWHAAFWGALVGHVVALVVAPVAAMTPAEAWMPTDALRGAVGLWAWLVLPVVGGVVGAVRSTPRR